MTAALLDTHAFAWAAVAPDRLSGAARSLISDSSTELYVSSASIWEMAIKVRSGKWQQAETLLTTAEDIATRLRVGLIDVNTADARGAGLLDWERRDPFDRMLAAQATNRHLPLITRDPEFAQVAGLAVIW